MNDDLEAQIQNSTTPHVDGEEDTGIDGPQPRAKTVSPDPNAPDPLDEKVFEVSSDFNITEAESLPTRSRSAASVYAIPPKTPPKPAATAPTLRPILTPSLKAPVSPAPQAPAPAAESRFAKSVASGPQKALRTYETDVMDVLAHKNISAASMALAENKKSGQPATISTKKEPSESSHIIVKALIALASLALIGGGGFGAYYLYMMSPLAPVAQAPAPQPQVEKALVPADSSVFVPIDQLSYENARASIIAEIGKAQTPKTIKEIIPTRTASDGSIMRVPGPDMLAIADVGAPDILSRSITSPWMLGVYADSKGNKSVFIVATTNFFQNAFSGMLQWESAMPENFHRFLQPSTGGGAATYSDPTQTIQTTEIGQEQIERFTTSLPTTTVKAAPTSTPSKPPIRRQASSAGEIAGASSPAPAATTSALSKPGSVILASSTGETPVFISSYTPITGAFTDRIIRNKDVREFKDNNGTILFLYSFLDNSHIILASSEAALSEAISRVEKQAFVR